MTTEVFATHAGNIARYVAGNIDYFSMARRVLRTRDPDRTHPGIAKDRTATAWSILDNVTDEEREHAAPFFSGPGELPEGVRPHVFGNRFVPAGIRTVAFPMYEGGPDKEEVTINVVDARTMPHQVREEQVMLPKVSPLDVSAKMAPTLKECAEKEDRMFWNLARAAAGSQYVPVGGVSLDAFEKIRHTVEKHRLLVEKYWVSRDVVAGVAEHMSTMVDHIDEIGLKEAGYVGNLLGATITTTHPKLDCPLPPGTIVAFTGGEFLGELVEWLKYYGEAFVAGRGFELNGKKMPAGRGAAVAAQLSMCIANPQAVAWGRVG